MVQEKESGLAGAHVAMSQNRVRTFSSVMNGSRFPAMQGNSCAGERERPMNGVAFVSRTKVSNDVDAATTGLGPLQVYLEEALGKKRSSSGVDFLRVPTANFEMALAEASARLTDGHQHQQQQPCPLEGHGLGGQDVVLSLAFEECTREIREADNAGIQNSGVSRSS